MLWTGRGAGQQVGGRHEKVVCRVLAAARVSSPAMGRGGARGRIGGAEVGGEREHGRGRGDIGGRRGVTLNSAQLGYSSLPGPDTAIFGLLSALRAHTKAP